MDLANGITAFLLNVYEPFHIFHKTRFQRFAYRLLLGRGHYRLTSSAEGVSTCKWEGVMSGGPPFFPPTPTDWPRNRRRHGMDGGCRL